MSDFGDCRPATNHAKIFSREREFWTFGVSSAQLIE